MGILGIILLIIFVISALLLVFMVLIQDDQGEGIGGLFGGGSSSAFGSTTGNVLTRFTTILGALFLIVSLGLAWINRSVADDDLIKTARVQTTTEGTSEWWKADEEPESEEPGKLEETGEAVEAEGTGVVIEE